MDKMSYSEWLLRYFKNRTSKIISDLEPLNLIERFRALLKRFCSIIKMLCSALIKDVVHNVFS